MSRFYDALREASRSETMSGGGPILSEHTDISPSEGLSANPDSLQADLLDLAGIPVRSDSPARSILDSSAQSIAPDVFPPPSEEMSSTTRKAEQAPESQFASKIVIGFDPCARLIPHAVDQAVVEHYRRLRTKILQQHAEKPFRSMMVTSPGPQEGKTVTVLNLGLSFAMLPNFRVLVVDGDLRRGSIGKWFGADEYPGLSDVLEGSAQLEDVALKCAGVSLHVVTRGNSKVSPGELLHSPRLTKELRRITSHFDLVLIDTPPVTLITDSQLLAGSCDAVLLIARAFHTKRKALEQSIRDLSAFRIIGTVLNGGTRAELYRKYNGYY